MNPLVVHARPPQFLVDPPGRIARLHRADDPATRGVIADRAALPRPGR